MQAKGSKINSKCFLNFVNWRRLEEGRLLVSVDGAESKDGVVLVPKVSKCFSWGFKLEWGALFVGRGTVCLLHNRRLSLSLTLLPREASACSVEF